ncbi:Planctomycete cytochrome C [Roseimaritima multifibrata]|uniref:Planctomycete cytochrome C n=2 Tax=Roseimaritima multifibrata TaxID=1930274 RepID=A0A517MH31_9BACT|nr:Planctomycete cytochrome C [Roseimaritima multifibrata]
MLFQLRLFDGLAQVLLISMQRFFLLGKIGLLGAFLCLNASGLLGGKAVVADDAFSAEQLAFFETNVRPLFAEHCYGCHSVDAKKIQAGLLMDSRSGLLEGGDSGAAMVPGDAEASLLVEAVHYESYEMPPKGKLNDKEIASLEKWVQMGAPWPDEPEPTATAGSSPEAFDIDKRKAAHWAWQSIVEHPVPVTERKDWARSDIDRFVLAKLESEQLAPAADIDRAGLVRRLYFDLTGLPPAPEQVQELLADEDPEAISKLVDQLLDSPHFGERWGRHWLDLVRYAESRGHEFDADTRNAYQYRDYVIRGLNADVPYDQWVREHVAGDLLTSPRLNPEEGFNESILGTGFWFLGEWVHSPVDIRKDESDRFDNMIDVMSKSFLGVTVACARCHDHKFDPISTADYYSLCGFLQSSDYQQVRFESLASNRQVAAELAELDQRFRAQIEEALAKSPVGAKRPQADGNVPQTLVDSEEIEFWYSGSGAVPWIQDGFLFGAAPQDAGQLFLDRSDGNAKLAVAGESAAVTDAFWQGLKGISESGINRRGRVDSLPRSGRTLRSPTFVVKDGTVSCLVEGEGTVVVVVDSHRLVEGPLHGETIAEIKPDQRWVNLNLKRYVGHRVHLEWSPKKERALKVVMVAQAASEEWKNATKQQLDSVKQAWAGYENAIRESLQNEQSAAADAAIGSLVSEWAKQRDALQKKVIRTSRLAMAMRDGTGEDDVILVRGSSDNPGPVEPRHFLTAISGDSPLPLQTESGRLELAAEINSDQNPLTHRVIVNRIWHHLIGRGIVPTTDDFGFLGERPTHPELLDYLALEFRREGLSIKNMIRAIVLSRTYQMSSEADPLALEQDPTNQWFHYLPPKRLEGEAIRDSLLSIAGRLDPTMYGEPVPIHLTNFMDGRGRPGTNGPLDGAGRRSIYVAVRRNFLSPFMLAFDTPVPFSSMGRRNVSNVPSQALILMNDPFVVQQAGEWAKRLLADSVEQSVAENVSGTDAAKSDQEVAVERVERMVWMAYGRPASGVELANLTAFVQSQAKERAVGMDDHGVWTDVAHALINTKEFIFLR